MTTETRARAQATGAESVDAKLRVHVEDGVAQIVLDNPPLNILTGGMCAELRTALMALAGDTTLRVLVLSGRGKHFSAGASVEEHLPGEVETMIPAFMTTIRALSEFPTPVIVAVHGRCLGGAFELALAGDMIIAGEGAHFGVPEINLGVLPPAACVQLPRLTTPGVAAEMIFTGKPVDAAYALSTGIVQRVVPDESLMPEALALADTIARHSAAALRCAKRGLRVAAGYRDGAFDAVTRLYLNELMGTDDATEGLRAFLDKREPHWSHR